MRRFYRIDQRTKASTVVGPEHTTLFIFYRRGLSTYLELVDMPRCLHYMFA